MGQYHVMITLKRTTAATREKTAGILAFASTTHDWVPHFVPFELDEDSLKKVVSSIRPDGAINPSPKAVEMLGCPIVISDGWDVRTRSDALVVCDNKAVAKAAAQHLWQRAFRQFAYIGSDSPVEVVHSVERRNAFSRELRKLGYDGEVSSIDYDIFSSMYERSPTWIINWLNGLPKPCGLFVYNDFTCQYIMSVCRMARLKVPEQIAIIGVDNEIDICENARPTLSSIEPDFVGAGFLAAKLLDRFMRTGVPKKPIARRYGVKKLHARMSTLSVIVPMKLVGAVMERIRLSEGRDVSVPQLAKEFGISERMLEYRFKTGQGASVRDEITKARLAAVERILTTTTTPIKEIPYMTGFGTGANLRHAFRKYRGVSLGQYRQDHSLR